MTALRFSPVCGLVQTFRVKQSSLIWMPGLVMVSRILRPTSVMPYVSISSWEKSAS
jgi:hypothetical protein